MANVPTTTKTTNSYMIKWRRQRHNRTDSCKCVCVNGNFEQIGLCRSCERFVDFFGAVHRFDTYGCEKCWFNCSTSNAFIGLRCACVEYFSRFSFKHRPCHWTSFGVQTNNCEAWLCVRHCFHFNLFSIRLMINIHLSNIDCNVDFCY